MDITDIRRKNLAVVVRGFGSQRKAGQALGISESLMSQYKNGMKDLGNEQARRIEAKAGLERGWMDHAHEQASTNALQAAAPVAPDPGKRDVLLWAFNQVSAEMQDAIVAQVMRMAATEMTKPFATASMQDNDASDEK